MSTHPAKTPSPEIGRTPGELSAPMVPGTRCTPVGVVPPDGTPNESTYTIAETALPSSVLDKGLLLERRESIKLSLNGAQNAVIVAQENVRTFERALAQIDQEIAALDLK